jgi:hypothetical protein
MGVPITRGAPGVFPVCPSRFAAFSYGHGATAKLKRRDAGVVIILVRAWGGRQAQAPGRGGRHHSRTGMGRPGGEPARPPVRPFAGASRAHVAGNARDRHMGTRCGGMQRRGFPPHLMPLRLGPMTTATGIEQATKVTTTVRRLPRLSRPVMLNAVKHPSGTVAGEILHFVQDDNGHGLPWDRRTPVRLWLWLSIVTTC